MKKKLLYIALLVTVGATAQTYQWQWAKRGGGVKPSASESTAAYDYDSEQIKDIVVDANNNYYFLAFITQEETKYENENVTVYNPTNLGIGYTDVLLIATTCDGTLRWTQTIGGGAQDFAYKLALDNNGGLYIGANVFNNSSPVENYLPPHFSPDDMLPVITSAEAEEGYKMAALLKYSTNDGTLLWRKMPQGNVDRSLRYASINQVIVQADGTIHALIGFLAGTHLNGQIIVPERYTSSYKYYIVKYNANGDVTSTMPLSFEGVLLEQHTEFRYDENLRRYYVAGFRNYNAGGDIIPLSYNSRPFEQTMYILAMDSQGNELWRKEEHDSRNLHSAELHGMRIDSESNIYICGKYFRINEDTVTFSNYTFPMTVSGNVVYLIKLNPAGDVLWGTTPSTESTFNTAYDIAINGDEVAVATEMFKGTWGTATINRGENHITDPVVVRFNRNTGVAFAIHDIVGQAGYKDALTAIAADNDGNYITGGYFRNNLFTDNPNGVATLTKVAGQTSYTDFFMAKLASRPCGLPAGTQDFGLQKVKLYPNPSSGLLYFEATATVNSYEVVNLLGQRLLVGNLKQGDNSIAIQSLSAGTYIINFTTSEGKVLSEKIIRE